MSNSATSANPKSPFGTRQDVNPRTLFEALLHAEHETQVDEILKKIGYDNDDPDLWKPLGGFNNNFSTVGNQQAEPAGALVEKIINSIDAILMAECYKKGIDPESKEAPPSMNEAVESFFNVKEGRISSLLPKQQTELAENIHLIATGSKPEPCYLIVDRGEGQTAANFPSTFLGLREENKVKIQFVQGKFHSGGTGVLQFCGGTRNYQLIASRRHPNAPINPTDQTKDLWGFTLIKRIRPSEGWRSSRYVYLAPGGEIPTFAADSIEVLTSQQSSREIPKPYSAPLKYGTCIKLYNFQWRAKGPATLDTRYELERFLHAPCLPFRVTETRNYKANYYSTTIAGVWVSIESVDQEDIDTSKVEPGFPAHGELNLEGIGRLPYRIVVFKSELDPKHLPGGICYTVNGQVHGRAPSNFISDKLEFAYLDGHLLVSIDCAYMDPGIREDWILNSRDRTRRNETDKAITEALRGALRNHPGLRELNAVRRQREVESALAEDKEGIDFLQELINRDPMLANLLSIGSRLITNTGPSNFKLFVGKKFPTFFRLSREPKEGLVRPCPLNRTIAVEFETDAQNDYFTRCDSPGKVAISPPDLCEHSHLWNGHFAARFRAPWNAKVGDKIPVTVIVTDIERESGKGPFVCSFILQVGPEEIRQPRPSGNPNPSGPRMPRNNGNGPAPALSMPRIKEIRKEEWDRYKPPFTPYTSLRIMPDGNGGYDFFLNIDNTWLLTELTRAKSEADKSLMKFWFRWGLALSAIGMLREEKRKQEAGDQKGNDTEDAANDPEGSKGFQRISRSCDGLAGVVIPIIRQLYRGQG